MRTLLLLCSLSTLPSAAEWQAQVVGVKGGNALEILREGKIHSLRLHGIDCPARTEALGKAARRFASQVFMADVRIQIVSTNAEGGLVGRVLLADGGDLSAELIKQGLAWWDERGYPEGRVYAGLEKEARGAYLGVWATPEDGEGIDWAGAILARREQDRKGAGLLTASN